MKLKNPCVHITRGLKRQFTGHQGRDAEIAVQQKGVQLLFLGRAAEFFLEALRCLIQERQPAGGGRGLIEKPGKDLTRGGEVGVYPPEAVDNPAILIQKNQIASPAHSFQHKGAATGPAQFVGRVQLDAYKAFQRRLGNGGDSGPGEMFPEEHTEHRRLGGILSGNCGKLQARRPGPGVEQQAAASEQENDLVPCGLLDLIDAQSQKLLQFGHDGL